MVNTRRTATNYLLDNYKAEVFYSDSYIKEMKEDRIYKSMIKQVNIREKMQKLFFK